MNRIKVLIVDDSAVTRKLLSDALSRSREMEVVGTALDPFVAVDKIRKLRPDVLTLDIEMPRMDGITFVSKLMIAQPMPVIMVSAFTDAGASATMKALEAGAVDFILKPQLDDTAAWETFADELIEKVVSAAGSKIKRRIAPVAEQKIEMPADKKFTVDVILPKKSVKTAKIRTEQIIAIGASTGGTEVIAEILSALPAEMPGIVIVQHMPEKFTKAFADRVNGMSKLYVKEAEHGERLYRGMALVAPGDRHMLLRHDGSGYYVEINDGPPVNRHRPSVDVIFRSVAQITGPSALGVILTGMGADGAAGLLEMKEAGAETIAQDEASSVVFGMPREAIRLGAASMTKNIGSIIHYLSQFGQ
ncbi:MAG TPA: chemotaxis response regulator protein-glutamate methylesterase [Spirochaetota bacterium]|nr:chemotaxis response regulator protein-glutamate methylesterase [Spirochaetota bacterium]